MVYEDIDDMYIQLDRDVQNSVVAVANEIKNGLRELINDEIYGSYMPSVYIRSGELIEAIRIDVVQNGLCDWTLDVYISKDRHSGNSTWIGEQDTYDTIFDKFAEDGFYRRDRSIDVMSISKEEWEQTDKAFKIIKQYLSKWFN